MNLPIKEIYYMKTKKLLTSLAAASMVLALALPATSMAGPPQRFQAADFHDFPGSTVAQPSAGTLLRTRQSISAKLMLSGLDAGAAYTVWWVIWNKPQFCAGNPCGLGDLGVRGNAVIYAAGFVTGEDGTANISADLLAGKLPSGIDAPLPGQLWHGRGFGVEAHMLVQSHGSIIPGELSQQISIDGASCNPDCIIQQGIAFLP